MIPIDEVLSIYKESQIDDFLKKYTGLSLNEKNLSYEKIKKNYKFLAIAVQMVQMLDNLQVEKKV